MNLPERLAKYGKFHKFRDEKKKTLGELIMKSNISYNGREHGGR